MASIPHHELWKKAGTERSHPSIGSTISSPARQSHEPLYAGAVIHGRIKWLGGESLPGIRVETTDDGTGGMMLESWLPSGSTGVLLTLRVAWQVPGAQPRDPYQVAMVSAYGKTAYLSDILRRPERMSAKDYDALVGLLWPEPGHGLSEPEHIRRAWRSWARFSLRQEWGRRRELSAGDVSRVLTVYRAELAGELAPAPWQPSAVTRVRTEVRLAPWERQLWADYSRQVGIDRDSGDDETPAITESVALSMALRMAPSHMPEGGREVFRALIEDPAFHAAAVFAISAYLALWLAPEPLFSKAAAIFTTVGLVATKLAISTTSMPPRLGLAARWEPPGPRYC